MLRRSVLGNAKMQCKNKWRQWFISKEYLHLDISAKWDLLAQNLCYFVAPKLPMPWPWMVLPDNFYATLFVRHTECFRPFFLKYTTYFSETPKLYSQFFLKIAHHPLCLIFMILVSLENVKNFSHVVARLPQRLKSTLFEIFSILRSGYPSGTLCSKKFQTMLILAFEANSAFVPQKWNQNCENHT